MARAVRRFTTISGFTSLTTSSQYLTLTPSTIPDVSTLTRIVGTIHFDFAPDRDPTTSAAALCVFGFFVRQGTGGIDAGDPNVEPFVWKYWRYQITRALQYGTYTDGLAPNSITVDIDVHGQSLIAPGQGFNLYCTSRLISALNPGPPAAVASVRFGIQSFYLLPEA